MRGTGAPAAGTAWTAQGNYHPKGCCVLCYSSFHRIGSVESRFLPGSGLRVRSRRSFTADAGEEDFVERRRGFIHDARPQSYNRGCQFCARSVAEHGPLQAAAGHEQGAREFRRRRRWCREAQRQTEMRFEDFIETPLQHDASAGHHRQAIGNSLDLVQQMRREKHGATFVGDRADNGFEHFAAHDRVEARAGFIQHQ